MLQFVGLLPSASLWPCSLLGRGENPPELVPCPHLHQLPYGLALLGLKLLDLLVEKGRGRTGGIGAPHLVDGLAQVL